MSQSQSILDPQKWDLLHQEGALLLEQINRKIASFPSTLSTQTDPKTYSDAVAYLERSTQRLQNLQNEYITCFESFQSEVKAVRTSINSKFSNSAASQPRASRGVFNLETSPTDVIVTYDFILSIYQREMNNKLDIISLFVTISTAKLGQYLQAATSFQSTVNSTTSGVTATTITTTPADTTSTIPNQQHMIELYPWLEQIFDQTNPDLSPEEKETKEVLYKSQLVDLNGIIAVFYQRPGFDLAQLNRLTSILKSVLAMTGGSNDASTALAEIIKSHSTFTSATPS